MKVIDYVLLAVIGAAMFFAIRAIRNGKRGCCGSSCSGNCGACGSQCRHKSKCDGKR